MKEKITTLVCFNLVNADGVKLRLYLGRDEGYADCYGNPDKGFRWSFVGTRIPMPVRAYTWFNGFPENIMLEWLKGNGWALHSRVEMGTGKATIYELPKEEKPSKGNETYELPIHAIHSGERALKDAVLWMYGNGDRINAISLYRYVHPTCLLAAKDAVDAIWLDSKR